MERRIPVDIERMVREFQELTAIDAVSRDERKMADRLKHKLEEAGCTVTEDRAGDILGGNTGNLYGFLKGTLPGPPILLSAHMDTVRPGKGKKAVRISEECIGGNGDTVLGADDVAGIVEILEGIRCVTRMRYPHRDVEIVFSAAEEIYGKGAACLDYGHIRAREAYVLDMSGPVGTAAIQAPSILSFELTVKGKAAHAGFEPEKGVHGIALMSRVIARIPQGRIEPDTTLNIGTIAGGCAVNIVPETCICRGEIRSLSHEKALRTVGMISQVLEETLKETEAYYDIQTDTHLEAYKIPKDSPAVLRFMNACRQLKLPGELVTTFGGSDNNHFVRHGIQGIVLSCGMYQVHSTKEYTRIPDLRAGAQMVAELITETQTDIFHVQGKI